FIPENSSMNDAWKLIVDDPSACFLVGNGRKIVGLVTRQDVEESIGSGSGDQPIASRLIREWPHVHADHSIEVALDRFRQSPGLLPVVSRGEASRVEGVITLETILQFVQRNPQSAESIDAGGG
ncbi:MAG: CBS domain-containing protein, partial [Thermoanaerobaculia bacterium]